MIKVSGLSISKAKILDAELVPADGMRGPHLVVHSDDADLHYFPCDCGTLVVEHATIQELEDLAAAGFQVTTPDGVLITA